MNETQESILTRIDGRLETVETMVGSINRKLFTGNGHSVMTRLGIAENNITSMKNARGEKSRGKFAIIIAIIAGFVSLLTSISVAYIAK